MKRQLKVYGSSPIGRLYVPTTLSPHRQVRHVVAARSLTEACRLLGTGRAYTSETGNKAQIEAALSAPGVVFWATVRIPERSEDYQPVPEEAKR